MFVVWQPCRFQNLGIMMVPEYLWRTSGSPCQKILEPPLFDLGDTRYLDFCLHTPSSPPNNSMNNALKIPLKSGQMLRSMSSEGKSPKGSGPFQASFQWNIPQLPVPIHTCTILYPVFPIRDTWISQCQSRIFNGKTGKKYLTMVSPNQKSR